MVTSPVTGSTAKKLSAMPDGIVYFRSALSPVDRNRASDKRGVLRIIQRLFFLFLNKNVCSDPSLEPSQ